MFLLWTFTCKQNGSVYILNNLLQFILKKYHRSNRKKVQISYLWNTNNLILLVILPNISLDQCCRPFGKIGLVFFHSFQVFLLFFCYIQTRIHPAVRTLCLRSKSSSSGRRGGGSPRHIFLKVEKVFQDKLKNWEVFLENLFTSEQGRILLIIIDDVNLF